VTALTRAGVTSIDDLAALTQRDLAAITGLGPGMIAAIRLVVPEPRTSVPRSGAPPDSAQGAMPDSGRGTMPDSGPEELIRPAHDPEPEPAEEEWPAAPVIPSFDSLRARRRHTAIDLLVSEPPPVPSATRPAPAGPSRPSPAGPSGPAPAGPSRPAEYADLLRLGVCVARSVAGVPVRVAQWSVRQPVRWLRRLLGEQVTSGPAASGEARLERE
jgi:hypothetical protein